MRGRRSNLTRSLGLNLLEVMLVLLVGAVIYAVSARQYYVYENNQYYTELSANVDQLFQAMHGYYNAQCYGSYNSGTFAPGTLNPAYSGFAGISNPLLINITNDLVNNGYLPNWNPVNPLLSTASGLNGNEMYLLQFNPYQLSGQGVTLTSCSQYSTSQGVPGCQAFSTTTNTNAVILNWAPQIAVQLPTTVNTLAAATAKKNLLSADCVSILSGSYVVPCAGMPATYNSPPNPPASGATYYLVWQRLPTNDSSVAQSNYWQSLPTLKSFNLQYTHDQFLELQQSTTTYYLCGGN